MWKSRVTRFPDRSARGSAAAAGAVAGSAPAALVAQCEWWSWTVAVGRHTMELSCPPTLAKKDHSAKSGQDITTAPPRRRDHGHHRETPRKRMTARAHQLQLATAAWLLVAARAQQEALCGAPFYPVVAEGCAVIPGTSVEEAAAPTVCTLGLGACTVAGSPEQCVATDAAACAAASQTAAEYDPDSGAAATCEVEATPAIIDATIASINAAANTVTLAQTDASIA
eukprot:COSAG06_NODE_16338_length_1006_cov_1.240353_1_plen_225_part_10